MNNNLMRSFLLVTMLGASCLVNAQLREPIMLNDFDLSDISVAQEDIFQGGPPRDGIPSIDSPKFIEPDAADFLSDEDRILGVAIDGVARAYPVRILKWHEVVNDTIADKRFSVTYCPLCGTGMVFSAKVDERDLTFAVSGLIYDNNVLLFDRETESLWSQAMGQAVSGPLKGKDLELMPVTHTTWKAWREQFPKTEVLSTDTGNPRDYSDNPYELYEQVDLIYFPQRNIAPQTYGVHEPVLGLSVDGKQKVYAYAELKKNGQARFEDEFNGRKLTIFWDDEARSAQVKDESGNLFPSMLSYWFAWYSFYPNAEVFSANDQD